jgi:phospholipid/cholesterol/gamma-HCH transport system substrate-binding protein
MLVVKPIRAKPVRERNPIAVAIAGLAILGVIALLAYFSGNLPVIGGGTTYTAYFAEAAGLQPGSEVRVAGVTVGRVAGVALAGDKVAVTFKVKGAWIGNASTAAIKIKTVLGDKYLALDPMGAAPQDPGRAIPLSRTTSPYDVTRAFSGLGQQISQIDTARLAQSLQTLSTAFSTAPPYVRKALGGLAALSRTVASRQATVTSLLAGARKVTGTLAGQNSRFRALLSDGNLLLAELQQRQQAIRSLLLSTRALAIQLSGLVTDDQARLGPALQALDQVTTVLQQNQANLDRALALAGPYYRLLGNTLGNGRWFDVYLCGLVPRSYLPPGTGPAHGCMPPKPKGATP